MILCFVHIHPVVDDIFCKHYTQTHRDVSKNKVPTPTVTRNSNLKPFGRICLLFKLSVRFSSSSIYFLNRPTDNWFVCILNILSVSSGTRKKDWGVGVMMSSLISQCSYIFQILFIFLGFCMLPNFCWPGGSISILLLFLWLYASWCTNPKHTPPVTHIHVNTHF